MILGISMYYSVDFTQLQAVDILLVVVSYGIYIHVKFSK